MTAFLELGIMPELSESIENMDWLLPTEIQSEAIPLILGGGDVLMASETGSGKTGAFCLPLVQIVYEQLLENEQQQQQSTTSKHQTQKQIIQTSGWRLSLLDRAPDLVLSSDHLTAQSKSGNWQGCRANNAVRRLPGSHHQSINTYRKIYYEVYFSDQGLARVGWSFRDASFDLGTDKLGFGFGGTGKKSNNKQFLDYGQPFGEKFDIVGCILDLNTGELSFTKNGRFLGVAFKIPTKQLENQELYPTICVKNAGCQVRFEEPNEKNDYKPNDCIWISDLEAELIITKDHQVSKRRILNSPLAIIMEPSRELAKQTHDCIETFSKHLGIRSALWVGGGGANNPKTDHQTSSSSDRIQIIVCTAGRLDSAIRSNQLSLDNIHFFILDEVDELLNQGHKYLINQVHSKLPKMFESGRRLQVICCSATLHNFDVKKLAQQLMYFPMWIDLKGEDSVPDTVHHVVFRIDPRKDFSYKNLKDLFQTDGVHQKDHVNNVLFNQQQGAILERPEELSEAVKLMKFYYTLKAIEALKMDQGIIFCRTKLDCDNLDEFMEKMNKQTQSDRFTCVRLHSSLSQRDRDQNLDDFKAKKYKFLICTDVAARGIDVRGVPFVIQVTLPDEKANYIHRIGRVGRADRMGLALSLVSNVPEKVWYHQNCNKQRSDQCHNTRLLERGGCCKWLDELELLGDIEQHLKCSIQEIERDFQLQVDEYDGKVVYGAKRLEQTLTYEGHVEQLKFIVNDLCALESKAQADYLRLYF